MTHNPLTEKVAQAIWENLFPPTELHPMPRFKDLAKGYEVYLRTMRAAEAAITTIKENSNDN